MSLFKELNPDMSLDEMRRIIKENSIKAINLKKKIEAIDAIPKVESNFKFEYSIEEVNEVVEDVDGIEGEDEEFEYYYTNMKEAISDLTDTDEMVNAIYDSMPSLDNKNYANIINRIKLELILEKNEWNEYVNDEDVTTRNDAIEEQKKIDFIINTVNNHHNVKNEELSKEENKTNNLIFLKTLTGNIYAESDLSYIDSERYPEFMELLESIEYGTFKDVKRLTINPILKGTAEVRGRGTRVVFDRVGVNTYIILLVTYKVIKNLGKTI